MVQVSKLVFSAFILILIVPLQSLADAGDKGSHGEDGEFACWWNRYENDFCMRERCFDENGRRATDCRTMEYVVWREFVCEDESGSIEVIRPMTRTVDYFRSCEIDVLDRPEVGRYKTKKLDGSSVSCGPDADDGEPLCEEELSGGHISRRYYPDKPFTDNPWGLTCYFSAC